MKNKLIRSILKFLAALSVTTIVIAAIIGVNILGYKFFHRFDLTAEQSYTVSAATKKMLGGIKDKLTIKLFISGNLPPNYQTVADYTNDIVEEYQKYSSKIAVERLDPIAKTDLASKADELGVQPIQFQVLDKDQFTVQKGYLGLAIVTSDEKNHESIPFLQDQNNLEYELTSMINKLTSEKLPTVGFTSGHDEYGINSIPPALLQQLGAQAAMSNGAYGTFNTELQKHYATKTVSLAKASDLAGIDVLIVGGPKKDFTDVELYNLDQYVLGGGKAIFLVDRVLVDPTKGLSATEANSKLADFIAHYGVKINNDLIADKNNEMVTFNSGNTQYLLPYPFWIKVIESGFNKSNPAVGKLSSASMPFVSSLDVQKIDGVAIIPLVQSSDISATVSSPFNLDPNQQYNFKELKSHAIAMEAKGKFTGFFVNKETPKAGKDETISPAGLAQSSNDGTVIVIGDADFLQNNYLQRNENNLALGLNLVDYLGQDESLIGIRAKSLTERPIRKASDYEIMWTRVINCAVVPLAVIAFGFWRFQRRKRNSTI